jgi:nitroreductase
MDVTEAIRGRRTVKRYAARPIHSSTLEALLELAVWAPNHRMTEPWRFCVLGPEAKRCYGETLGGMRARKMDDPAVAEVVLRRSIDDAMVTPATLAFVQRLDPDPGIREEDYASIYMGIQNLLLGATAEGLVAQVKTGPVLEDEAFRAVLDVSDGERVVALVHLGEPLEPPSPRPRRPAVEQTRWLA